MAGSHLDHCKLSLGVNLQKRERHTDAVVEITLSSSHAILHRKHLTDELLSSGLTIGSGKSDHHKRLSIDKSHRPMPARKLLESLQSILHKDQTLCNRTFKKTCSTITANLRRTVHDSITRTKLQRLQSILIAVKVLTTESKEHLSPLESTCVCCDYSALLEFIVD